MIMENIWELRDQNYMSSFIKIGTITQRLPVIVLVVIQAHVEETCQRRGFSHEM